MALRKALERKAYHFFERLVTSRDILLRNVAYCQEMIVIECCQEMIVIEYCQ